MRACSLLAVLAVLAMGCASDSPAPTPDQAPAADSPAPRAEQAPAADPPPPEPVSVFLGDGGLDGYPGGSAFTMEAISEAVAPLEVVETEGGSEGMVWTEYAVVADGGTLLTIGPDGMGTRVGSVRTSNPAVELVGGASIGDRFGDVFSGTASPNCVAGMEEMSGLVNCNPPGAVQFFLVFEGSWNGPDGEVPPADVLQDWRVREAFWTSQ